MLAVMVRKFYGDGWRCNGGALWGWARTEMKLDGSGKSVGTGFISVPRQASMAVTNSSKTEIVKCKYSHIHSHK